MVTILKYKKITIDRIIYIKVFYDVTVSYPTVSTDGVLNTYNNRTTSTEIGRFFEEDFDIEVLGPVDSNHGNLYNKLLTLVLGRYGVFHDEVNGTE